MTDRRGHLKISRKFFEDDPWWLERRVFSKADAWLDLLYLTAFRARKYSTKYGIIELDRGQFVASRRMLAERWRWSEKAVRNLLEVCQKGARIRAQRETQAGTIYLIVNYDLYQSGGPDGAHERAHPGAHIGPTEGPREKQLSSKAGKPTWLTPFAEAWSARCGNPPFARLAKILAPLTDQLGAPEALARWSRYLEATEPRFCSPNRFSDTHAAYAKAGKIEMTDTMGIMREWTREPNGDVVAQGTAGPPCRMRMGADGWEEVA